MAVSLSNSAIWEEIELSESYLVSCMFEEARSLAASILLRVCNTSSSELIEDIQMDDMMESAGMVLVQSLKELGRTSDLLNELKVLFGSVTAIPVQVLLTGACFQISEGCSPGPQAILEEFLANWKYVDGQSYVLECADKQKTSYQRCIGHSHLGIEKYIEVAEVYAVNLLGAVLGDADLAISWVEEAKLPEEKRQEILRRLQSLYSFKGCKSSVSPGKPQPVQGSGDHAVSGTNSAISGLGGFSRAIEARYPPNGDRTASSKSIHPSKEHLCDRVDPWFWWFRASTLKFSKARFIISCGRITLWAPLIFFIYYVFLKKKVILKRVATLQALSMRKALIDIWQLAFSFQVNPLAAVQPLPVATHGNR